MYAHDLVVGFSILRLAFKVGIDDLRRGQIVQPIAARSTKDIDAETNKPVRIRLRGSTGQFVSVRHRQWASGIG